MLSVELKGGLEASERFMKSVRLPVVAPSLGGVETLVTRPATTSHSGMSPEDRSRLGISDGLIRVSIGIESTNDLLEDFSRALSG
jgi:cystathionine beta-lyase/cystathionine gamma-synthase